MTYELALKLKEAGYPQELRHGDRFYHSFLTGEREFLITHHGSEHTPNCGPNNCECECDYCYPFACKDGIKSPTLSELIEACGMWFYELIKQEDKWYAGTKLEDGRPKYGSGTGSTPEEAVANLYLALQKK